MVSGSALALHPGVVRLATGTTVNATGQSEMRFLTDTGAANHQLVLGVGVVRFGALVKFTTLTTPFANHRIGLTDQTFMNVDPAVGFTFRFNPNVNSGKIQRGIAATYSDTGVTVQANFWYLLEFTVAADAKSAEFFINGVSVGTSSSATAQTASPVMGGVGIDKDTSSGTSRVMDVDLVYVEGEMNADRFGSAS